MAKNGVTSVEKYDELSQLYHDADQLIWNSKADKTGCMTLDGNNMTIDDVMELGQGLQKVKLSPEAEARVNKSRKFVEGIVADSKVVYGITTGFGNFAKMNIPSDSLAQLQQNLVRSHAGGVGQPLNPEQMRHFMSTRINNLAKGYSGISLPLLNQFIAAFNANCFPWVPHKGTVGASGDLAPLAHMTLGLMGEGKMWSPETGWDEAKKVLEYHNLEPITLGPKEGLAMINGTQFMLSLGVEAVARAARVARAADIIAALTLEALKGTNKAFDEDIHQARPHKGQLKSARQIRALMDTDVYPSEIKESHKDCGKVQDPYSMRCTPQVHGIVHETIDFVAGVLSVELNGESGNPIVFFDQDKVTSGGNFHGEYIAKVLDYLAIGVHELASISERRTERMISPAYNENLPDFLVVDGGTNSGLMMSHATVAALVSENKVLCHPSSVDTITTSGGTEDHVSMGGMSARKAVQVVEHVEQALAVELMTACQAIEFHRPLKSTEPLEAVHKLVRTVIKRWDVDRWMAPDIHAAQALIRQDKVWQAVQPYMEKVYKQSSSFKGINMSQ